ncbi:MAG: exodeoxyribonuclease VII large subunit [Myxococcaceae bacterium]
MTRAPLPPGLALPLQPAPVANVVVGTLPPKPVQPKVLTVGDLTRQIKGTLERNFTRVLVRGEVSGFRGANARGHLYFSLKDSDAQIDSKIWASMASRMKFKLRDGLAVVVEGHIDLYEPQGRYSLIVSKIEPEGEGALALAFQQLKERLTAEGLMGEKRVRPPRAIPFLARRIGVVTSRTGAALQDFLCVLYSRHPRMSVLVADARVQGEGSAQEVVRAIERLSRTDVDVIVVTRGGGSMEDLWTFNEELVARAIHACPVPVVSAIGHEIDFTIADFVADFRAPTPSAAAEKLAPVLPELELSVAQWKSRLRKGVERKLLVDRSRLALLRQKLQDPRRVLDGRRLHLSEQAEALNASLRKQLRARELSLKTLAERLSRQRPEAKLAQNRQALSQLKERLVKAMAADVARKSERLRRSRIGIERRNPTAAVRHARGEVAKLRSELLSAMKARTVREGQRFVASLQRLDALSPLKVMGRGYSVAFDSNGHVVRRAADVSVGATISVRVVPPGQSASVLSETEEIIASVTSVKGSS